MRTRHTPNDPERRERLVVATMDLLYESGVPAVSARAVARRAGVPVGSVSYHFDSVKALLVEASSRVAQERLSGLEAWARTVTSETVVRRLAEMIHHQLTDGRELTVIAYELYILGLRDEDFRQISHMVIEGLRATLALFCTPTEATRLAAAADGIQLASLVETEPPSVEDLVDALRREPGSR